MGTIKHKEKVLALFRKSPVVSVASLKKILGEGNSYIYLMLNNMVRQGAIYRITKGWYSLRDDPTLAVFCFKPSYLGLQNALSVHNLWEQETTVIILTATTARQGVRSVFNTNVLVHRIPHSLYFGVEFVQSGNSFVPVSDVEKTFLDMLYFDQPMDAALIRAFRKRITLKRLKGYLKRYDMAVKSEAKRLVKF